MKDLKLDEITHDLVTDTDLQLVSGIDYYALILVKYLVKILT
jgi:hypothetical protein